MSQAVLPPVSTQASSAPGPNDMKWATAAIIAVILLQIELVVSRPVNWDEFYHLSEAHAFHQGRLAEVLQVFYARAFFWLPLLPTDAIGQIRVARSFMLVCELFTALAIFRMATRFTAPLPAALSALAYVSGGYVFQHGFSYRADPMAAAFLMGALWIMLASKLDAKAIAGIGLLVGLAVLTTIKVIFYAPAFAGIAWLRWCDADDKRAMLLRLFLSGLCAVIFASAFIGLTILSIPADAVGSATKTVSTSGTMMFEEGIFPRWPYAAGAAMAAPILALLVLTTPLDLKRAALPVERRIALLAMMMPLLSLLIYRNSFPYFYSYILAPVMIATAVSIALFITRFPPKVLVAALALNAAVVSWSTPREVQSAQKDVLAAVHEIFPEPVAYFDFPGLVVDYPKANFFMTTWGMKKYRLGIEQSLVDAMEQTTVPLLVVNQEPLTRNQTGADAAWEFLPEDATALREGFIAHWGPIWVAGRHFGSDVAATDFIVRTPGTYTLEGTPARIDGRDVAVDATVVLDRGVHRFERRGEGDVILRWGDHLARPARSYSGLPVFDDF